MHFIGKVDSLPASGEGYSAGDVIMVPDAEDANVMIEYVLDKAGTWQKLGHESIYELKADAKAKHDAIEKAITDLEKKHDDAMAELEEDHTKRLNDLDKKYDDAIKGLDHAEVKAGAGEIIEAVSQADGAISVSKRALASTDFADDLVPEAAVAGLTERLAGIDTAIGNAQSGALQDAKDYSDAQLKDKIETLDYTDAAVAKQFVTSVSEADGIKTPVTSDNDTLVCTNPRCITSVEQEPRQLFKRVEQGVCRCMYCEAEVKE